MISRWVWHAMAMWGNWHWKCSNCFSLPSARANVNNCIYYGHAVFKCAESIRVDRHHVDVITNTGQEPVLPHKVSGVELNIFLTLANVIQLPHVAFNRCNILTNTKRNYTQTVKITAHIVQILWARSGIMSGALQWLKIVWI